MYKEIYVFIHTDIVIKKFTRNLDVSLEVFEWQTQVFVDLKIFVCALWICVFFSQVDTTEHGSHWLSGL